MALRPDLEERVVVAEAEAAHLASHAKPPAFERVIQRADRRSAWAHAAGVRPVAGTRDAIGRRRRAMGVGDDLAVEDRVGDALHAQVDRDGQQRSPRAPRRERAATSATGSAVRRSRVSIEPPLPRGSYGLRPESGLLASDSAPRLPGEPSAPQWLMRRISARSQWRDRAGFAPGFPGHRPLNGASIPHRVDTLPRPLKSLAAILPPSSRGLGRRPLTAETGVRIPVAVLLKPAQLSGFRRSGRSCAPVSL